MATARPSKASDTTLTTAIVTEVGKRVVGQDAMVERLRRPAPWDKA